MPEFHKSATTFKPTEDEPGATLKVVTLAATLVLMPPVWGPRMVLVTPPLLLKVLCCDVVPKPITKLTWGEASMVPPPWLSKFQVVPKA